MMLAAHLGRPSPTAMLDEMIGLDWALWCEYLSKHPIGEAREDLRMALQTSTLVNLHIPKGRKRTTPGDFLFNDVRRASERPQSWQEQLAIVQALAAAKDPTVFERMERDRIAYLASLEAAEAS